MMGKRVTAEPLFYTFRLEDHVSDDHSLRTVDAYSTRHLSGV